MCLVKSARVRVHWKIQIFQGLLYGFIFLFVVSMQSVIWQTLSLRPSVFRLLHRSWLESLAPAAAIVRVVFNILILFVVMRAMRCRPEKFGLLVD